VNFCAVNDDHRCVGETVSEAAGLAHPHDCSGLTLLMTNAKEIALLLRATKASEYRMNAMLDLKI